MCVSEYHMVWYFALKNSFLSEVRVSKCILGLLKVKLYILIYLFKRNNGMYTIASLTQTETEMGRRRVQQRLAGIHLILSCIEGIHLNNKIQSAWQHQTGLFSEWFSHKRFIKRMSYGFSFQTHKFSNSIIPFPRSRHCARVCACVA